MILFMFLYLPQITTLTDRPDMTLDVYRGRKTTIQQIQQPSLTGFESGSNSLSRRLTHWAAGTRYSSLTG